jgi:hypothetical protein
MRSKQLNLKQYATDKIVSGFLNTYDSFLQHLLDRNVSLLELGVKDGGSLLLWRDYFPMGNIVGVDLNLPAALHGENRIQLFQGSQGDPQFLTNVARQSAPAGFDVIIDDASHIGALTRVSFWHLFENHLKPGGLYVIEDWGTGYWDDWPDGRGQRLSLWQKFSRWLQSQDLFMRIQGRGLAPKLSWPSHSYGMVGFVKELIDEQAAHDSTKRKLSDPHGRPSRFEKVVVMPALVFVVKRS